MGLKLYSVKRSIERLVEQKVISNPPLVDGIKGANRVTPKIYLLNKRDSFLVATHRPPCGSY